jgi:ribosomal protein S18 acetylase RimI-like enzyme
MRMVQLEIRRTTEADLDACARLIAGHDERPLARHRERLARDLAEPDRVLSLVATLAGATACAAREVVASGRLAWHQPAPDAPPDIAPAGWYLIGLIVAPEHRGAGIGLALTDARIRWALERAPEVWYFTGTANTASYAMHARLGFEEVTRRFSFPRVPFELGGVLCRVTAQTWTPAG